MPYTKEQITGANALGKRIFLGAMAGWVLISFFLISAEHTDPAWDELWWLRPLVVMPAAGALAAIFNFYIGLLNTGGWKRIAIKMVGGLAYLVAAWLGLIIAVAGYYWH